jgi:hypothetical protein
MLRFSSSSSHLADLLLQCDTQRKPQVLQMCCASLASQSVMETKLNFGVHSYDDERDPADEVNKGHY